jgi:hypothetical protein
MIRSLLIASIFFIPSVSHAAKLEFKFKGKVQQSIEIKSIKKSSSVTVLEPHMDQLVTYEGKPFNQMMDDTIGRQWRQGEEVLFTCLDGYQSSIPVKKFEHFRAWLVWARRDGKPFEITNKLQYNEKVLLGPIYLVWENQKEPELLEGGTNDFPYQVASLDVISFKERFPKIAPPVASSQNIKEGFLYFRKYCLNCHAIDGEGGQKAPDLKMLNLFGRLNKVQLRKWILSPQSMKPTTLMPPFAPKLPNREKAADMVVDYLEMIIPKK